MATCTYNPGINNSNPYATLTVTESSYSVANNTSVVAWDLKLYRPYNISSSASKDYSIKVNGSTVKSGTTTLGGSGTKTIASGTTTINHNADGSKTISFSFSLEFGITWSGSSIGTGTASGSLALTTIPRATTPTVSASSVDFGTSVTVTMSRASSSFTHTLKYTFAGSTATIGSSLGTSQAWTVPLNLMSKIPNATSGTLTFTCETYNGSTKIGSKTVNITVKVPSSVKPTVTLSISEGVANIKSKFGVYVKGLSKLSITATGTGSYSSTIKSYKITANGQTFTTATATTNLLTSSGTLTISATVTDSRGRTGTVSNTVTVYDYTKPVITSFTGVRTNSSGTESDDGTSMKITIVGKVANINNNTATYSIKYKPVSSSSYTTPTISDTSLSINKSYIYNNISTEESYEVVFTITDAIGNKATDTIIISTAFTLVDYHESGKGMAIGKVAEEEDLFDVNLPIRVRQGIIIDSDWINLTLSSDYKLYNDTTANQPQYKVSGNTVTITGAVSPKVEYTSSLTPVVIASGIPAKFRPAIHQQFICQGSGMNRWVCAITTAGEVTMSRYGVTEPTTVPTGAWLIFSLTYQY